MKHFIIFVTLLSPVIFTGEAYAYLDAGSGSYMLQMLLATVAAGLFAVKHYWKKIKQFMSEKFGRKQRID